MDFSELVTQARDSGADCVFMAEFRGPPVLNFLEGLRATEWSPSVGAQTAVFSDNLFRRGEKLVEGLLLSTYYVPDSGSAANKAFTREFRRVFESRKPTHREANSYDTLRLAVEALDEVGSDREQLREYFSSIGGRLPLYEGVSGKFGLDRNLGIREAHIIKVEQGTYRPVHSNDRAERS